MVKPQTKLHTIFENRFCTQKGDSLMVKSGVIYYKFFNPGDTITAKNYWQEIDEMHQKLQELRSALVDNVGFILLQDIARPHVTFSKLRKLYIKLCLAHHINHTSYQQIIIYYNIL